MKNLNKVWTLPNRYQISLLAVYHRTIKSNGHLDNTNYFIKAALTMPRKSTDILEPETPTRRSSRLSIAPSSRTDEESSATKRTSRKKKAENDDVLPPIDESLALLEPVTPKRVARKSKKPEDLLQDDGVDDDQSTTSANATTTTETVEADIPSTPEATATKRAISPM